MLHKTKLSTIATLILTCSVNANALQFGKPVTAQLELNKPNSAVRGTYTPHYKTITFMRLNLSPQQKQTLLQRKIKPSSSTQSNLLHKVDLGMNNVPVLDQGRHGSCVTFAVTAAIDAAIDKGDYISQLCTLEHGSTLEKQGYLPSGWDGSIAPFVTDQINRFGVINKSVQENQSCAGIKKYPLFDEMDFGNPLSIEEHRAHSEDLSEKFYPIQRLNAFQQIDDSYKNKQSPEDTLQIVKSALNQGHRLTFGSIIVPAFSCRYSGWACAKHKDSYDTWAVTPETKFETEIMGHELVIIGYDDNAIATDRQGNQHRGLLKLRNSWGPEAGDHGDFYMTYEYFKQFAFELQEIVPLK